MLYERTVVSIVDFSSPILLLIFGTLNARFVAFVQENRVELTMTAVR